MKKADEIFTEVGLGQHASVLVDATLKWNGEGRRWLSRKLKNKNGAPIPVENIGRWWTGIRKCPKEVREQMHALLGIPEGRSWFMDREVVANDVSMGLYEGKAAKDALDSYAGDVGYKSWDDLLLGNDIPDAHETIVVLDRDGGAELRLSILEEWINVVRTLPLKRRKAFVEERRRNDPGSHEIENLLLEIEEEDGVDEACSSVRVAVPFGTPGGK